MGMPLLHERWGRRGELPSEWAVWTRHNAPPPPPPPPPSPPWPPAPPAAPPPPPSSFTVVGPCTVDGACARSPNYPSDYGNRQSCTITPTSLAVGQRLSATTFNTESGYDKLIVNGATYSGTIGPSNVLLGSAFTWSSDRSVTRAGWEVCAAPVVAPRSRIIAEPSAKAAATHGAGSLIVGTLGVALVAALTLP